MDPNRTNLRPLHDMSDTVLAGVRVLATDIDDTITAEGRLAGRTVDLLAELGGSGLIVALVTGRSAGWAQALAGYLPGVCLAVGENGLVGFDNQEMISAHLYPGLSTMELPHYEMGVWATNYLLQHIDHDQGMNTGKGGVG